QTDIIPKLCFSDSGRSKTWRFVKISSSNFLTITILSLYEKVKSSPTFGRERRLEFPAFCVESGREPFDLGAVTSAENSACVCSCVL
ncbi:unnamed protein product, partial [Larinioides sclopetarius]